MKIINYTTAIDAYKTIGEIQGILVAGGADRIMFDYKNKQPIAVRFTIIGPSGSPMLVTLPARPEAVHKILVQMKKEKGGKMSVKSDFDQAVRVAWRILKDWIEVQFSLIATEQAEMAEIFMPYLTAPDTGQTMYQALKAGQLALPGGMEGNGHG